VGVRKALQSENELQQVGRDTVRFLAEIIHTCSHEKVAHAAVASMGPSFAEKVRVAAGKLDLSTGAFAARVVREFDECSGEAERQAIRKAMGGSDQPILTGLRLILRAIIEEGDAERVR
jgi:hypothetical protein